MSNDNIVPLPRRNREREGKSARSWIKHEFIAKVAGSYIAAYRVSHPRDRVILIDGNAGDGQGVPRNPDLFDRAEYSRPSPEIVTALAEDVGNADVLLCEKDKHKRKQLYARFPKAMIVATHDEVVPNILPEHRYALWISDPCGPAGHGIDHMRAVSKRVRCDFVVVFNEGIIGRFNGTGLNATGSDPWKTSRERYGKLIDPQWWLDQLGKRYLVQSDVIRASANFNYRVWAISNFLADCTKRRPFIETIERMR